MLTLRGLVHANEEKLMCLSSRPHLTIFSYRPEHANDEFTSAADPVSWNSLLLDFRSQRMPQTCRSEMVKA